MNMSELSFAEAQEAAAKLSFESIVLSFSSTVLSRAIRIRAVENSLLDLFQSGKIGGTIHTCMGKNYRPLLLQITL
jgi:TPP-dependent pyruvate/acetoin dehydrogenase alpha subunit